MSWKNSGHNFSGKMTSRFPPLFVIKAVRKTQKFISQTARKVADRKKVVKWHWNGKRYAPCATGLRPFSTETRKSTDSTEAIVALGKVADEMESRYRQFPKGVRTLTEYNQSAETPMPRLIVVIDELSDLMTTSGKLVETSIARIAQKGRAAGIHLMVATQSPRAEIITGKIKANLSSRIAFAAASAIESHIILDEAGAEKLVGKGDMLFRLQNENPRRLQGCYITPEEIEQTVASLKAK